jgi:hypothetical protein
MTVEIIPDWDTKKAINIRNHYEPILNNNQKIICDQCGKRHFPDEETFVVIYGNIMVGFRGGIIGNFFTEDGKLARAGIYCRSKHCIGKILERLIDEDDAEDDFEDEDNLRNCTEIG